MRCRDYPVLLLAAAVLTAPRWACADQQGATKLGEVVVTATKTEVSSADAPAAVSVVTAGDIQDMNVHSADEALTYLPGVYATRTGGHAYEAKKGTDLEPIYKLIDQELRGQYLLTYTPDKPDTEGGFHKISLTTSNKEWTVSTREGYYAPEK